MHVNSSKIKDLPSPHKKVSQIRSECEEILFRKQNQLSHILLLPEKEFALKAFSGF